LFSFSFHLN